MSKRLFLYLCLCTLFSAILGGTFYVLKRKPQYAKIPVHYNPVSDIPLIELEIESKKYVVELDSGGQHYIALQKRCLDQIIDKESVGSSTYYDMCGKVYEKPIFQVPRIQINNFKAYPIRIVQEDLEFLSKGSYIVAEDPEVVQKAIEEIDGRVGSYFLSAFCMLLDLPHSVIYICRDQRSLPKEVALEGFTEVPLFSEDWPVVLIETEHGCKKALIDTGCSWSLWRGEENEKLVPLPINRLKIGALDFGSHEFTMFPFTEKTGVDAILGLDFIKNHRIFIDLKGRRALISPPAEDANKNL